MKVMVPRACGLDIHKDKIMGCIITPTEKEIRTFGTMTHDLLHLLDWIKGHHCMEPCFKKSLPFITGIHFHFLVLLFS